MVAILIRHADDKQRYHIHRHDKEITRKGKREAKRLGNKLINKYGEPDIIYCSPMMRTKQTLKKMLEYVNGEATIVIDNRLSRYFNHRERDAPSLFTTTANKDIPIEETRRMFKKRCDSFLREIRYDHSDKKIWIITHALVFKRISKKLRMRIPSHIGFLEYRKI